MTIVTAVMADFNAGRATAIPHVFGEFDDAQHSRPPRVSWLPDSDSFAPAEKSSFNPRPLYTLETSVTIKLWAADFATMEGYRNDMVGALHRCVGRSLKLGGGDYVTTEDPTKKAGAMYLLRCTFRGGIADRAITTATIEEVSSTTEPT